MVTKIIEFSARNRYFVMFVMTILCLWAWYATANMPMDALPDLSDTQVIIYSKWDRSPGIIEDQVTYPITAALLGAPKVKSIRGFSDYGYSYIYVIFEDGTDIYWARSRTLEYLSAVAADLPEGVRTELGPDATSLGWVFQYVLTDDTGKHDLAELRSYQDWFLKYQLQSVEGVSEVAGFGGHVKQYQVNVNPAAMLAYNIPFSRIVDAVRSSNDETGGRVLEIGGREYMVRVSGYIKTIQDIESIPVGMDPKTGTPVYIRNVARVSTGPDMRRGVADYNGMGDSPGGIIVMRHGENALEVIERVKERIAELEPGLPEGMKIIPTYDRSHLINRAVSNLKWTLLEEMILVSLVIMLFLWHLPSATVAILTIPVSVFLAFIPFYYMGLTANIMSLAGIAISIGVLVDGTIVEVENAYKKIEHWMEEKKDTIHTKDHSEEFFHLRLEALKEVGPSVFFSLLVVAVAFIPVFTLLVQEGRLFRPLAWSKNMAMGLAALLALTLDPAFRMMYSRYRDFDFKPEWLSKFLSHLLVGKYYNEEVHPVSRVLFRYYEPVCRTALGHPWKFLGGAGFAAMVTVPAYMSLGSEFMPPLNEGTVLYMPTTLPGIAVEEAERSLQIQSRLFMSFPEVESVHGKAGRAETATDPAPFSMAETVVVLKPESEWRRVPRWYYFMPEFTYPLFRLITSDRITYKELMAEMDAELRLPGWTNAFTMPIRARLDMLSTGIRTPIGIKVYGNNLNEIEKINKDIEEILRNVPGTRSIYGERVSGGYFLDYVLRRDQLARYGLTVGDAQKIISSAVGGENITVTVEGRERYPVNVRYERGFRESMDDLKRILVPLPGGAHIPIGYLADIEMRTGPAMIRNENGMLAGYVYIDIEGRDIGSYIGESKSLLREKLFLPAGYSVQWSGQYENMERVKERLKVIIPLTLLIIILLIYMNTRSPQGTAIVLTAVPFSLIGAVWILFALDYDVSIAVWVGMIALLGLDAETGTFMLLYLNLSYNRAVMNGKMNSKEDLTEAIVEGAVKRIRPKIMTVLSGIIGLLPILWSDGTGADVMKRIAAPMVGGLVSSFALELLLYPVLFEIWKKKEHGFK